MNKKTTTMQIYCISFMMLLIVVNLSGCTTNQTENQNTNENVNAFLGTWIGTLQMSMFDGRSNASISQITFTSDRAEVTIASQERTFSMNYSYTTNGDSLVLTPMMTDGNRFPGEQPFNGTMPPNGTRPPENSSIPPNGTQPPGNGSWPLNGKNPFNETDPFNKTRSPGNNPPSMTVSFVYAFDKDDTVLYLNNVQFIKIQ